MKNENKKINTQVENGAEVADETLEDVSGGVSLQTSLDLFGKKPDPDKKDEIGGKNGKIKTNML